MKITDNRRGLGLLPCLLQVGIWWMPVIFRSTLGPTHFLDLSDGGMVHCRRAAVRDAMWGRCQNIKADASEVT